MSYISRRLFDDEEICYTGRFSGFHHFQAWMALIFLGVFLIGIYLFIKMKARFATTEFVVTSRRVILKEGLFNVRMIELELDAIEGGYINQSFFGRMFKYGDVHMTGRGETNLDLPVMAEPAAFLAAAEKARVAAEEAPVEHLGEQLQQQVRELNGLPPKRKLPSRQAVVT